MQETQAILVASFGTTHVETLEKNITAIEDAIRSAFEDASVRRAFTSRVVVSRLKKRYGIDTDTVEEALDRLAAEGFERVAVQPTHMLCGEEYEKLCRICQGREARFQSLEIGAPLLAATEDYMELIHALMADYEGIGDDTALVFVGHGSRNASNAAYAALNYMFGQQGFPNAFVGTVEAYPDVNDVLVDVRRSPYKKVLLAPLMVVAGDHAANDIAGEEPDSWKSIFESAGYPVRVALKGLGEYARVREIYARHCGAL